MDILFCFNATQERNRSFDGFSMHSLENSLIDIMRAEQDTLKGEQVTHNALNCSFYVGC